MEFTSEKGATEKLSQIGYYRLSGYWYPFRNSSLGLLPNGKAGNVVEDTFREGTTFDSVIQLYVFDKKLRLLLLDALERIEITLRTRVALQMGEYDPWSFRNSNYLDHTFCNRVRQNTGQTRFQTLLDKCNSSYDNSRETFVEHFREKYNQPLPVWAAIELWDFGTLSMFIEGMRYNDKKVLADGFDLQRPEILPSWVRTLAFVRNVCAHHNRLWNRPIIAQPKSPRKGETPLLDHLVGDNYALERVYSAAAITRYFLLQINPSSEWQKRFIELTNEFPIGPGISLNHSGFPEDWKKLGIWS